MYHISRNMDCRTLILLVLLSQTVSCSVEWNWFTFSQSWIPTLCEFANHQGMECKVPDTVTTWQIHGLWPNDGDQKHPPINCNISSPFNYDKIKKLESQLELYWRNVFTKSNKTDLWQHEWETHGRCATTLKATGSEYLYFKKSLELGQQYPVHKFLASGGIKENGTYEAAKISKAVKTKTKHTPSIRCGTSKSGQVWLSQVFICLNKKFNVIDCGKGDTMEITHGKEGWRKGALPPADPCGKQKVYYPPLKRKLN